MGLLSNIMKKGIDKTFDRMGKVGAYLKRHIASYDPKDVLCAFDIDMTLLQPEHPSLYVPNVRKYFKIYQSIRKKYPTLDTTLTFLYSFLCPQRIVDPEIYSVLESIPSKKIALTATLTGPFLQFDRLDVLRYKHLKEQGISFEGNFNNEDFVLEECPSYRTHYPSFYKGVLCSNSEKGNTTKGTVLCAFLRKLNWIPKCIVLVDDRVKNLRDVYNDLKKNFPSIKFIGIEYLGAHNYCPTTTTEAEFEQFWLDCFEKASHLPQ